MTSHRVRLFWRGFFSLCMSASLLYGCGKEDGSAKLDVQAVFPEAAPLGHRHRNHSMTETPDGLYRVFAAQRGDLTDLMLMKKDAEGRWGMPVILDLPRRETNTSPRFSHDGVLYYSSDAPHPARPGRKDLNIWRVALSGDDVGVPEVLPDTINSGSHEDGFAPIDSNRAVFSSTTLGGSGGYDLYIADNITGEWRVSPFPHNTAMADSHPVMTRDGGVLIWYAHMPMDAVYGSVDLFMSRFDEGEWSAPQNLGPHINTAGIDYGPGVSGDGYKLFFSRDGVLLEANLAVAIDHAGYVAPSATPACGDAC